MSYFKNSKFLFAAPFFLTSVAFANKIISPDHSGWLDWKSKLEASFQNTYSAPAITHHIYLEKVKDKAFVQTNRSYPRFTKETCSDCPWEILRVADRVVEMVDVKTKQKIQLPMDVQTQVPGNTNYAVEPVLFSGDSKIRVFFYDLGQKDLAQKRIRTFYGYNSAYKFNGKFQWLKKERKTKVQRSDGSAKDYSVVGEISFTDKGKLRKLSVYNGEPNDDWKKRDVTMLLYRDKSNGKETYGAGRFLTLQFSKMMGELKDGDGVIVDLNYSYNPPCAVSTGFHCPLPQDLIDDSILAGERYISRK